MVLVWDEPDERTIESGIDKGVLYLQDSTGAYPLGKVWNGLRTVAEKPEGAEETKLWASNRHYGSMYSVETFAGSIECYTYPDDFKKCLGIAELAAGVTLGQQTRQSFGFAYRTRVGNAVEEEAGYKIHLIYGCRAKPAEASYATDSESPEAVNFSFDFTTIPASVTGNFKPTALVVIDTRTATTEFMEWLEPELYGTVSTPPNLPSPADIQAMIATLAGP